MPTLNKSNAVETETKPFRPHRLFRSSHAQTLAAHTWPRRVAARELGQGEARLFEVEPGVKLLVRCHWQKNYKEKPTVVLVHGLEGSSDSVYMVSTGHLFYRAKFNVLRLNMRNCGGTAHLTPTLYHSGMSDDLRAVLSELIARDELSQLFLIGHSMGGNLALKMTGDWGAQAPPELFGICAVSPALDLSACADAISHRSNWIYQRSFLAGLRRTMLHKQELFPDIYDASDFDTIRSIREFDERYTARHGGFQNADDYYQRASAIKVIAQIKRPALIIHAQDDPFIPFSSFTHPALRDNPHIKLLAPRHGGHVGFLSDDKRERFWAEHRALEFCRGLLTENERTRRSPSAHSGITNQPATTCASDVLTLS